MGKSPGKLAIWGIGAAEAYRDAIDWAGVQPWSNGNVGLWGMSYLAMGNKVLAKDNLKQALDSDAEFRGKDVAKAEFGKL